MDHLSQITQKLDEIDFQCRKARELAMLNLKAQE